MNFTDEQKNNIIEGWGQDIYARVLNNLEIYAKKWGLSDFEFVEHYSINIIFFCKSEMHGNCVLKIGSDWQDYEFAAEYNVLREYNGGRYAKVYDADIDLKARKKVMLIERVIPGEIMDAQTFEKRLEIFTELFNGLHIAPENPDIYESYESWILRAVEECEKSEKDLRGFDGYMQKARDIYLGLREKYNGQMLLHIDLYGGNVVSCGDGKYKIIDPKGVIGDPVFDTAQYIFNECCEDKIEPENIEIMFNYLENSVNIPRDILRKCFYIETVRFISYYAARYGADDWDIERVKFADKVLNEDN